MEKELQFDINARTLHQLYKQNYDREDLTEIQKAARFLYLIKSSYGGKITSFGGNFRNITHIKNLEDVHQRLSRVLIENKSFEDLIRRHDSEKTLFYCDPPYYETEKYIVPFKKCINTEKKTKCVKKNTLYMHFSVAK